MDGKASVIAFNDSLRIVHAQWHDPSIELILNATIKTLDQNGLLQVFQNEALKMP